MEKITLCGDNCLECPRYLARTTSELEKVAELWFRVGWRDRIVPVDEIRCSGCTSHKQCTYHLVECTEENNVEKCNQCSDVLMNTKKNAEKFVQTKNTRC